jgi:hypothetical protein
MPAEKILLRWMNFHLRKAGHWKIVSNFSSDVKVFFSPQLSRICVNLQVPILVLLLPVLLPFVLGNVLN